MSSLYCCCYSTFEKVQCTVGIFNMSHTWYIYCMLLIHILLGLNPPMGSRHNSWTPICFFGLKFLPLIKQYGSNVCCKFEKNLSLQYLYCHLVRHEILSMFKLGLVKIMTLQAWYRVIELLFMNAIFFLWEPSVSTLIEQGGPPVTVRFREKSMIPWHLSHSAPTLIDSFATTVFHQGYLIVDGSFYHKYN